MAQSTSQEKNEEHEEEKRASKSKTFEEFTKKNKEDIDKTIESYNKKNKLVFRAGAYDFLHDTWSKSGSDKGAIKRFKENLGNMLAWYKQVSAFKISPTSIIESLALRKSK